MYHWNHGTLDDNHFHVWTVSWGRPYTENTCCILSIQKIAIIRLGKNSGSKEILLINWKENPLKLIFQNAALEVQKLDFWNTVKPFFSKKCKSGDQKIILCEDNKTRGSQEPV